MKPQHNTDELAGEYVLGTLSAARRHEVEQRLPFDADLRTAVQQWQEQLLPLASLADPVEPSAQLWQRIEASLGPVAAPEPPRRVISPPAPSWWNSVKLWRGLAGGSFATAAVMAAVLVTRLGALPAAPQYMGWSRRKTRRPAGWCRPAARSN